MKEEIALFDRRKRARKVGRLRPLAAVSGCSSNTVFSNCHRDRTKQSEAERQRPKEIRSHRQRPRKAVIQHCQWMLLRRFAMATPAFWWCLGLILQNKFMVKAYSSYNIYSLVDHYFFYAMWFYPTIFISLGVNHACSTASVCVAIGSWRGQWPHPSRL